MFERAFASELHMTSSRLLDNAVPEAAEVNAVPGAVMDETSYRLLRLVEDRPDWSQRELAGELGISLGKVNYCLRALIEKGWVKARNFRDNRNKLVYAYLLTPRGLEQKAQITLNFIRRKMAEYEALGDEIAQLRRDFERQQLPDAR